MKYFKLFRNDGVYWITPKISELLLDLNLYSIERRLRNCYKNKNLWIEYNTYKFKLEKYKINSYDSLQFGMFKDNVKLDYENKLPEKFEQGKDYIKAERIFTRKPQTLDEVQQMFNVDTKIWECSEFTVSNWDITSTKAGRTATNYAVKAKFKRRTEIINYNELIKTFINDTKNYKPNNKIYNYDQNNIGNLLEIPIMDLHLGKLGWSEEVGEEYNSEIAEERFLHVIMDLVERAKNKHVEKILFPIGNDFFNFDTPDGTTTKGTRQDNDIRWQKMFKEGCKLLVCALNILSKLAPVDVLYVPANHDYQTSYYAMMYIYGWFHENQNINIDISPKSRKYYRWGKNLIGFAHGDKEKNRINNIMQVEASKDWGETKFREWHLAHLHSEHAKESGGIIIRHISSITGTDAWHSNSGYIGAIKKAQSFLWNRNYGLLSIQNSIIY